MDNYPMKRIFRSPESECLPKVGYGDSSQTVRYIHQWISDYIPFTHLIHTLVIYCLAWMKKSEVRLIYKKVNFN